MDHQINPYRYLVVTLLWLNISLRKLIILLAYLESMTSVILCQLNNRFVTVCLNWAFQYFQVSMVSHCSRHTFSCPSRRELFWTLWKSKWACWFLPGWILKYSSRKLWHNYRHVHWCFCYLCSGMFCRICTFISKCLPVSVCAPGWIWIKSRCRNWQVG